MKKAPQVMLASAIALCLTADGARAQGTTPSPFHVGQWGIEAFASGTGGGLLRFITPRTAIVVDVSGTHRSSETTSHAVSVGEITKITYNVFDASLGLRRHVMTAPQLAVTYGVGGLVGTSQQRYEYAVQDADSDHRSYLGGYAEIGGQYNVINRFAVGLSYRLRLQHDLSTFAGQSGNTVSAGFVPVRATLYF